MPRVPKNKPYYVADVLEPFSFKYRLSRNSVGNQKVERGDVIYIQRTSTNQVWLVAKHNLNGGMTEGVLNEADLVNKIKVRRGGEDNPISGDDAFKLYEEHEKPKWKDLSNEEKDSCIDRFIHFTKIWSEPILEKAEVEMPTLGVLVQKYFTEEQNLSGDRKANIREFIKKEYDAWSDNPWCYINQYVKPFYFKRPAEEFISWLRKEVKREEIKQSENKAQLAKEKKLKEWAQRGLVPCPRCGGAGRSEAWKYTGSTCFECDGAGYIDPLMLENSGRMRLGLPPDYEECDKYLKERAEKNASENKFNRLWCSAFNDNNIGKIL